MGSQGMTPAQIGLVQESFAKLRPNQDATAQLFYLRLLELDPGLQNLFCGDLKAQRGTLMAALGVAVDGLNDLEALRPVFRDLGLRHVGYGVKNTHYERFGEALLWTLEIALGDDFDTAVRQAWTAFYELLSSAMTEACVHPAVQARSARAHGRVHAPETTQEMAFPTATALLVE